jgi:hypothetical protein
MKVSTHATKITKAKIKDWKTFSTLEVWFEAHGGGGSIDLFFNDRQGPISLVNAIVAAINTREAIIE